MTREEGVELRLIGRNDPQESLSPHTPSSPESNPNWKTLSYLAGSIIYVAIFTLMGSLLRDLPGWWMASIIAPISLPGILFMIKGKRTFLFHQEEAHADPRFITLHRLRLFFISVFLLAPICGGLLPSYLLNKEYASSGQSPLITNLISVAQLSNTSISTGFYRFQQIHLEVQYSKKGSYGSVQKKTFCLAPVSPSPGFVNATKIVYVWGIISPSQSCDNSHALFDAFPGGCSWNMRIPSFISKEWPEHASCPLQLWFRW